MKRIGLLAGLALALALALTACQKNQETQTSSNDSYGTEQSATDQTAQAPSAETTPPPEATPAPAPAPKPRRTTSTRERVEHREHAVAAEAAKKIAVPVGTQFDVSMVTPLDTRTSNVGDKIEGHLTAPITQDGVTIAPEGAVVRGEVTQVQRASKDKSEEARASLAFVFTSIETVDGEQPLHASVTNAEGKLVAGGTSKRDALIIGGSAVAGAVLGKVLGKDTKGAVIGAVGGAAVGTGIALTAKGHELEVPAGSKVQMRVDEPITVVQK
jgi:hypothetical protein